ncbi:MAG: hypothetical protein Tsb0016_02860 [Sphingomonadales bacterium]
MKSFRHNIWLADIGRMLALTALCWQLFAVFAHALSPAPGWQSQNAGDGFWAQLCTAEGIRPLTGPDTGALPAAPQTAKSACGACLLATAVALLLAAPGLELSAPLRTQPLTIPAQTATGQATGAGLARAPPL